MAQSWNWRRVRELAAWLVLAVVAVSELISLVRFSYLALSLTAGQPWYSAAQQSPAPVGMVWALALLALVLCCLLIKPVVLRTRQIASWSAIAVGVAAALELFYLACVLMSDGSAWARVLDGVGRGVEVLVSAVVAAALWRIRGESPRVGVTSASVLPTAGASPATGVRSGGSDGPPPVWRPEQAVGVQWNRAQDAAAGAPADEIGGPGAGRSGWQLSPGRMAPQDRPAPPRPDWPRGGSPEESPGHYHPA